MADSTLADEEATAEAKASPKTTRSRKSKPSLKSLPSESSTAKRSKAKDKEVLEYEPPVRDMRAIEERLGQVFQECSAKGPHEPSIGRLPTASPVRFCPYKAKGHMGVKTWTIKPDGTGKFTQPHYLSMQPPCWCGLAFLAKQIAPRAYVSAASVTHACIFYHLITILLQLHPRQ